MIWILLTLIVLDALSDAFYDNGKKYISGLFDMALLGVMIYAIVMIKGDWRWMVVYVLLRSAVFNTIYNLTRGLHPFYVGSTKLVDKLVNLVGRRWDEKHIAFMFQLMSLAGAIGLTVTIMYR